MNCEKCKNRKATLFYADEGGGRHALCSVCGANQSKLGNFSMSESASEDSSPRYIPSPSLLSISARTSAFSLPPISDKSTELCKGCGASRDEIIKSGALGCPECYEAFGTTFFPTLPLSPNAGGVKMPSLRRARLEKERNLKELKAELKAAISDESFELAVIIRDKIRNLENT
jgi:protein arginine kinase activator